LETPLQEASVIARRRSEMQFLIVLHFLENILQRRRSMDSFWYGKRQAMGYAWRMVRILTQNHYRYLNENDA
jgi:hypothetical protein